MSETSTLDTDRCEMCMKTAKTVVNGEELCRDCAEIVRPDDEFISSPARTVHRGNREDGAHCGQTHGGKWATVDADDAEEAVMKYDLVPCTKCIENSLRLNRWRVDVHGSVVVRNAGTPERWSDR